VVLAVNCASEQFHGSWRVCLDLSSPHNDAANGHFTCRYLVLTSTFDTEPTLRFGRAVLSIIIISLLTGGYSLTLLLWFACPSLLFRRDSIFTPTASVSAFSFLASLYLLASSSRYSFAPASCGVTLALTSISATLYGTLAYFTSRRVRQITRQKENMKQAMDWRALTGTPSVYSGISDSASNTGTWMEPAYYQNFVANMHPTARSPHQSFDATTAPPLIGMGSPPLTEDDMVNQKLAMLLKKNPEPSPPDASQETFRLEWPIGDDDEIDPLTGRQRQRTFSASGRLLAPGQPGQPHDRNRPRAGTGPLTRIGRAIGVTNDRGRTAAKNAADARARSREERRREIELGNMASQA
jgi:hypothetical protein